MATALADQLPPEGNEVILTGTWEGERRGYYLLGVDLLPIWWEAVDGPDVLLVGVPAAWEHNRPPPDDGRTPR